MTRGCGSIESNAVYARWRIGNQGIPISQTVLCPIWVLDFQKLKLNYRKVNLLARVDSQGNIVEHEGRIVYDAFDLIGVKYYPYKTDFYEEGKRKGFNRRIGTNVPVDLLTPGLSLWYMCTARAAYESDEYPEMIARVNDDEEACIKYPEKAGHYAPYPPTTDYTCTSMWWYEQDQKDCFESHGIWFRQMPWGQYRVRPRDGKMKWVAGAFMALEVKNFIATTKKGTNNLSNKVQSFSDKLQQAGFGVQPVRVE